ncbi:hypothetical protein LOK49_LG12G02259 [Camellia lanceoleosa]|uniref:Uncharacterized protein n=1 Tax=Camellia lanceoleosa TaxID=1840588 RepID=A0ACC0FN55_9ERIC|nr:hypothetical protein LOK49_LG12G02259 [Camellia lanceoleosa]
MLVQVVLEACQAFLVRVLLDNPGSPVRITNKNFIDYLFVQSLEVAIQYDLPMQIHTGLDNLIMNALNNLKEPGGSNKTAMATYIEFWCFLICKRWLSYNFGLIIAISSGNSATGAIAGGVAAGAALLFAAPAFGFAWWRRRKPHENSEHLGDKPTTQVEVWVDVTSCEKQLLELLDVVNCYLEYCVLLLDLLLVVNLY